MFTDTPIGRYELTIVHHPNPFQEFRVSLNGKYLRTATSLENAQKSVQGDLESTLKKLQEFLRPAVDNVERAKRLYMGKAKRLYPPGTEIRSAIRPSVVGRVIGDYSFSPNGSILAHTGNGSRIALYHGPSNKWAVITKSQCGDGAVPADMLLEEARRRYPVGTVFKSARSSNNVCIVHSGFIHDSEKYIYADDNAVYNKYESKWAEVIKFKCPKCHGVTKDSNHCGNPSCPAQPCCGHIKVECRCIWENADMSKMQP